MPNILFLIIPIVAFNAILLFIFLAKKSSQRQPTTQQPEQQTEGQTTPTTSRKLPIGKAIATILVIVAIVGIFFYLPGDLGDKIEKVKSVIPRDEKVPDIPMKCVIHITDFRGEDRIQTSEHIIANTNNEGHLIMKTTDDDWSATIYLALGKELQEKKVISMKYLVKVTNNGQSGFGGYVEDSDNSLRAFTFDNQRINLFVQDGKNTDHPYSTKINGEYEFTLTRIVSDDLTQVELRASVTLATGDIYSDSTTYRLFQEKNLTKIGLDFYSKDRESELEISEIIVYTNINNNT